MSEQELWNELGNLYFLSGAYSQAAYAYHRSIELDDNFGRPYSNLALTYVQQGKYDEAIELYRRSIELLADNKEKAISWNRLGNVYRHLKDYRQATVAYQHSDELDPENTEGREEPGQLLYGSAEPIAIKEEAMKEEPLMDEAEPMPQHAEAAVASGPDEAPAPPIEEAETASWIPLDPIPYQQDLSDAPETASSTTWMDLEAEEEDPDLDAVFEEEIEEDAPDFEREAMIGWLPIPEPFESDGSKREERNDLPPRSDQPTAYQKVEAPDFAPAPSVKSNAAKTQEYSERSAVRVELDVEELAPSPSLVVAVEETEAAETQPSGLDQQRIDHQLREENAKELQAIEADIAKFKRMVQVNPRNSFAWDALGSLYKSAGLYKEAILAHQQAISIDSSKASYYHHLGLVYAAEGRDEDAINAFQKVIELDPDYSLAHATLGGYYRKMGLEDLAQKHIGKAMRIIYDSENEYNRACLEAICGNVDKAIELLQIALRNKQTYVDWVLRDPDLDFIRGDPRFKQLISEYTR
jgi:tetratricopeptide (TPR) repeat protein